ncbi:HNH endonuclease family protein [Undibacterium curvum]|uniref:HNH endonuclease n=1 Tax=Undibacterium curvum TaxID=2762294 RepID=A0ABR7A526_9BURK|nr:HNH endonuclease [Undibacterium curvum]MBC3932009.1 HNH endonuclease [Undibacterium curvum]
MTKSRGILTRAKWTAEKIEILKQQYADQLAADIASSLGMKTHHIYRKAKALGLKKSAEFYSGEKSGRTNGQHGKGTRFFKGQTSWNQGLKGLNLGGKQTQFKPGQTAPNTQAIGSYRITKDGTLQRKISNNKGSNSNRWRGVHELVWVESNGAVPEKHIVVFKPGTRTTVLDEITIEKVECISLAENMKRNTVHNLPKELVEVVRLRAVINRKINRVTKENHE